MKAISGWIPHHCIGTVLVSLPAGAVFSHVTCDMHLSVQVDVTKGPVLLFDCIVILSFKLFTEDEF